ncbi:single-pass membrane protein with aspartate-rich tail 1b [Trichomycterus rosablanca]|uniref:single-pass membrane protein with aspartate-rich tail 1b n=1 Tax=Trichomycterus rosablanca TaxID=2290929 RepID=UPI002F35F7B1
MALGTGSLFRTLLTRTVGLNSRNVNAAAPSRNAVTSTSGAILPKPEKTPFGLVWMTAIVVPFLYLGTLISKNFAAVLEEHDIFVPDDDDD